MFESVIPGCLPVGTETAEGVIAQVSMTAYRMTSGEWVAFRRVHGTPAPVAPLVVFA